MAIIPSMTELTAKRPHYPALDGLRGVAILLVVFFHNFGFISYSVFGWLGVDLFFVLSGYLITDILLNTVTQKNFLKNFYARRALRIFPLYYLFLFISFFLLPLFNSLKTELQFYIDHQWWLWLYLQNWLYSFNTPPNTSFLNHLWSLAVEEQFYLIWPFLILLIRKPKYLLWLMVLVLFAVLITRSLLWINKIENLTYSSLYTFTRIDGICIGCIVALSLKMNFAFLKKQRTIIVLTFAALNFIFYFINQKNSFPYFAFIGYTTFAAIFGLLVYEIVTGDTKLINLFFNQPVLKFFGSISYSFYIFHWPLYLAISPSLKIWVIQNIPKFSSDFFASAVATILACLLAYLSYRFFEMRFLKLKKRFS